MKYILAALFAALLLLPAYADTQDWVKAQRRLAARQATEGKSTDAIETLRLAIAGARRDRLHGEAALALAAYAEVRESMETQAAAEDKETETIAPELTAQAIVEARAAGDVALEQKLCEALAREAGTDEDREAARLAALDAAIPSRAFDWLGDELFFERDVAVAFQVLDAEAEAALSLKRGDAKGASAALAAAIDLAEKQTLPLTAAELRLFAARAAADPKAAVPLLGKAVATFEQRGDHRGLAEANLALGRALLATGDLAGASRALEAGLLHARERRDADMESRILFALADASDSARKPARLGDAARAEERRHAAVMRAGEEAVADPTIESEQDAVAALRGERERRPANAAEVDRLLGALGAADRPHVEMKAATREKLKALLDSDKTLKTIVCLEALRRTEAFPVIADAVESSEQAQSLSLAIESLATHDDFPRLVALLSVTKGDADESAAAAIFRLATAADLPAIRKALGGKLSPAATLWLKGVLAREGDAAAMADINTACGSSEPESTLNALAILGRLGYGSPYKAFATLPADYSEGWYVHRVLARAPGTWGAGLRWKNVTTPIERVYAARGAFLRGDSGRIDAVEDERQAIALCYLLPRTPAEQVTCGTAWILNAHSYMEGEGDELLWVTDGNGISFGEAGSKLKAKKNPLADFAAEDLEFHRFGQLASAQTRVLTVDAGGAWATCKATAVPEPGEIVNDTLTLPFRLRWLSEEGDDGSLAGKIGHVSLKIELSTFVPRAEIRIPGFEAVEGKIATGTDDRISISAALPRIKDGEGLAADKPIPMETLAKGTVTLFLQVGEVKASMTFPLAFLMPPKKDKPDLVAEELILEPAVPKAGEEVRLLLRARNIGKAVGNNPVISVRFTVLNPQAGEGKRTISVVLDNAGGWRPGESREFEAKPRMVQDYYMNRYAMSWTVEMGDTRLFATIDANNAVEEDKEDNNTCELEVPLRVPDDEAKRFATDEMLAELDKLMKKVDEAKTPDDARIMIGVMKTVMSRSKVSGPELDVARLHLEAAVQFQVERLRVRAALDQAVELAKDPNANKAKLKVVMADLVQAQADLLESGVPVQSDTLTDIRNRTQASANAIGSVAEYKELAGTARGMDTGGADKLKKVGDVLNRIDGALQVIRYARDTVARREADPADVVEGIVSMAGGGPGMSKLHQAMVVAEMDYVRKGFKKEATVLEELAALIGGDKTAQARLDAACKDAGDHVKAGPFSKDAMKNIALGGVKDVPILGKIVDAITSWK